MRNHMTVDYNIRFFRIQIINIFNVVFQTVPTDLVLKYLAIKKLMNINSNHVIEIIITSKRYSLWIPCTIDTSENDTTASMKPVMAVHLMVFSSELVPLNMGNRAKNEIIINVKPVSSSTINIPCGLN